MSSAANLLQDRTNRSPLSPQSNYLARSGHQLDHRDVVLACRPWPRSNALQIKFADDRAVGEARQPQSRRRVGRHAGFDVIRLFAVEDHHVTRNAEIATRA